MKLRRRPSPLLLILIPSLATAIAYGTTDTAGSELSQSNEPRGATIGGATTGKQDIVDTLDKNVVKLSPKVDVGTKDAPVDGKDGKPHAGPFVDAEKDRKPAKPVEEGELVVKKPLPKGVPIDPTIPEVNDGVMNDPTRELPKHGTTGTEGGVSEKDKTRKAKEGQTGEKVGMTPDPPKEAPPLPHSEQEKMHPDKEKTEKQTRKGKGKDKDMLDDASELAGFEKPVDLPDSPHAMPQPLPNSANKDHLDVISDPQSLSKAAYEDGTTPEGLIQPLHSFLLSLTMILFSEIGDKTFLIAALMAMKHDRLLVFSAAFSALIAMTILSAVLGHTVPTLLPKRFTNLIAAILFLIFGVKMLREGLAMDPNEGVTAEMQEVEQELEEKEHLARQQGRRRSSVSPYALEMGLGRSSTRSSRSGSRLPSPPRSPSSSSAGSPSPERSGVKNAINGLGNLLSLILSPVWVQTFAMTFLGEWGDRSQIATIAMAAGQDYWWVTGGAVSGHAVCTGVAVIGGRAIAGKVSLRVVTLGGAIAFLVFGIIYLLEAIYYG